jgi:aminopeptidase YwaD
VRAVQPADFRVDTALRTVQRLAGGIGPRHATSPAFDRAAAWVAGELSAMGYDVRRQRVAVPGGISWGVRVDAGTSVNVIATPPGLDPRRPHLVLGAHLDTVPQAPGAEDNASGVGVVLAAADAIRERRTRLPVVLVAFGAEEPRGPTDADHHYGSRAYVASLGPAERRAVRGMLSLDRVGVGTVVPVSSAGPSGDRQRGVVLAAARQAGVPTDAQVNRSSDHWQFVLAGMPGIRIGSTPYAAYHSAADLPPVVSRAQLARSGRLVLAWLR